MLRSGDEVRRDLVAVLTGDQRAHLRLGLRAVTDRDLLGPVADRLDERVGDLADGDDDRNRHAALACRAVPGGDGGVGGHVHVGVRQDDHVVLRAGERLHPLARLRPRLVDVFRDRRRPDEADRGHVGMLEQPVDRDLVALDDVEDAVRHAGFLQEFGDVHRCARVLLGRLEHERVAARQRRSPHPHGHHRGEVERRDPGDDAERLPDRVDVDSGRRLLGELALEQRRDAAGVLDHLEPAGDLAQRVGMHLAVLACEEARDVVAVLVEQRADAEEELGAARQRERAPGGEGGPRGRDRSVDLLGRREVDLGLDSARGRVVDRARTARPARDDGSVDPVADPRELLLVALPGRGRNFRHLRLLEVSPGA